MKTLSIAGFVDFVHRPVLQVTICSSTHSYLEFRTMDKVQKPSDTVLYTIVRILYIQVYEKGELILKIMLCLIGGLCDLVVRLPGYTMEMYCVSREVRTEFIYVM
jgi:hypothetical protein